ncbi:MAG: hypothetical protein LIP77_02255 [Planctomycetes bacterium]|nr:hypothetical protein [Planctomycetota bacterium]
MDNDFLAAEPGAEADPALFAERFLGLSPTGQQRNFFAALAQPAARVAVRSGHGTGKSTALAASALWFLATRRDGLVACTAPTGHQLQDVLWRELRRLIHGMDEEYRDRFTITNDRVRLQGSAGMIAGRTSRPENPDALQGFHAPEILFLIDEAAGVADTVFEVARGALSTASARVALAGNPTRINGYFYEAFHGSRENWQLLHFSCLESPLVAKSYPEEIAREYGQDSDMYRVRVLGDFPQTGMHNLISLEVVEAAMAQTPPESIKVGRPVFGVDPAWLGGDRAAGAVRWGGYAEILFVARRLDTLHLTDRVYGYWQKHNPITIFIDQTGVGAGVHDQLRQYGLPVTGVSFAHTPLDKERFLNRRAELWWRMRKWLEEGGVLQHSPDLRNDLVGPEYQVTPNGKIQVESKDSMRRRGLASPDLADALALTFTLNLTDRCGPVPDRGEAYDVYQWMQRS